MPQKIAIPTLSPRRKIMVFPYLENVHAHVLRKLWTFCKIFGSSNNLTQTQNRKVLHILRHRKIDRHGGTPEVTVVETKVL